jgi:tetratricopeptide (TPR) repeat protein
MLETIREYALELLANSGEGDSTRRRHAGFFLEVAERAEPKLRTGEQVTWLDRLEAEHDNMRGALQWAIASGDGERVLRLSSAMGGFWDLRSHFAEGREWFRRALALVGDVQGRELLSPLNRSTGQRTYRLAYAWALYYTCALAGRQGNFMEGGALLDESLALMRELGERTGETRVLNALAYKLANAGSFRAALAAWEASLAAARETGDKVLIAGALANATLILRAQGAYAQERVYLEEAVMLLRQVGQLSNLPFALGSLGSLYREQGDYARSRPFYAQSLQVAQEGGGELYIGVALMGMGHVAYDLEDYNTAQARYTESQELLSKRGGSGSHWGTALAWLGCSELQLGHVTEARAAFHSALKVVPRLEPFLAAPLALMGMANVQLQEGNPLGATVLLSGVQAQMEQAGVTLPVPMRDLCEQALSGARAQLSEAEFSAAWAKGRALTMEQAVALALETT